MAYVTPIGSAAAQVEYQLTQAHGCGRAEAAETPRPDDSADQLLERADQAMYRDKNRPAQPPEA